MIYSKANDPEHGEFTQDSKEVLQGGVVWVK